MPLADEDEEQEKLTYKPRAYDPFLFFEELCRNCSKELELQRRAMGSRKDERKRNLLASAVVGAAGLALGWAALELGTGGILRPGREAINRSLEPKEVVMEDDQAVLLVEEVANGARVKDTRTKTQIEEDEIVEALDEGSNHTKRDKERGTSKWRS